MRKQQAKSFRRVLFLSFSLPLLLLLTAYLIMQFWPVGDRSPLTIDLYHQYVAFISELRRKILNGESLFYSWSVGLGTNFYALLAYYAASPMNLFLLLFPPNFVTEAVTFLIITKIGLSGLSFATLLYKGFCRDGMLSIRALAEKKDCGSEDFGTDAVIVALATAYALNAFNLAYSWDIMWLDVIALLPLVVLGIHQLIRERKFAVYALSLGLTLTVNYYMAFFVCLFSALYFFVSFASAKGEEEQREKQAVFLLNGEKLLLDRSYEDKLYDKISFWSTALRFAFITLLAVALSAFLLFPTAISLAHTSAAGDKFPGSLTIRFSLFDFLTQLLMNIPPSIRDGLPNVYCGLLAFVFVPLYAVSQRISLKEKASHLALLAFLFLSFNMNVLDFIWHGFHYPNQLPYRYSFLFSFTLLLIVFRTFTVIREFSTKTLLAAAGLGIIFVILAEKLKGDLLLHGHAYINIFFFLIYLLLFSMLWRPNYFRTVALLLAVVMVGELAINTIITVAKIGEKEVYTSRSAFVGDFDEVKSLTDKVRRLEGDHFYRLELMPAKTTNDGALYGYPGYTLFSSTSREDTAKFMRKFAYHGNNINSYKYVASTPVGNSVFGLKYLIYKSGEPRDNTLKLIDQSEKMKLYENPYALSPGIVAEPTFAHWNPNHKSPFVNWNMMLREMADVTELFQPLDLQVISGSNYQPSTGDAASGLLFKPESRDKQTLMRVEVPVEEDCLLYFAVDTSRKTEVEINVRPGTEPPPAPGETVKPIEEKETYSQKRSVRWLETFDVGACRAGEVAELTFKQDKENAADVTVYAAKLDPAIYKQAMAQLKAREIRVTDWRADGLTAEVNAAKDSLIYFSIPYDESWQVTVDGQSVTPEDIGHKAFLAVPVKAGSHSVNLVFRPEGFLPGLILSLGGLLIFALLLFDERKFKARREKERLARQRARALAKASARRTRAQAKAQAPADPPAAARPKPPTGPSPEQAPTSPGPRAAASAAAAEPATGSATGSATGPAGPAADAAAPAVRPPQLLGGRLPLYRPTPAIQPHWEEDGFADEKTGE